MNTAMKSRRGIRLWRMARALCVLLAVFIQTSEAVRSRHSVKRIREASSTGSDDSAGVADLYRTLFSGFSPVAEEQREHQRKLWVQEAKAHVREERLQRRKAKRKALALLQKGDWGPIEAKNTTSVIAPSTIEQGEVEEGGDVPTPPLFLPFRPSPPRLHRRPKARLAVFLDFTGVLFPVGEIEGLEGGAEGLLQLEASAEEGKKNESHANSTETLGSPEAHERIVLPFGPSELKKVEDSAIALIQEASKLGTPYIVTDEKASDLVVSLFFACPRLLNVLVKEGYFGELDPPSKLPKGHTPTAGILPSEVKSALPAIIHRLQKHGGMGREDGDVRVKTLGDWKRRGKADTKEWRSGKVDAFEKIMVAGDYEGILTFGSSLPDAYATIAYCAGHNSVLCGLYKTQEGKLSGQDTVEEQSLLRSVLTQIAESPPEGPYKLEVAGKDKREIRFASDSYGHPVKDPLAIEKVSEYAVRFWPLENHHLQLHVLARGAPSSSPPSSSPSEEGGEDSDALGDEGGGSEFVERQETEKVKEFLEEEKRNEDFLAKIQPMVEQSEKRWQQKRREKAAEIAKSLEKDSFVDVPVKIPDENGRVHEEVRRLHLPGGKFGRVSSSWEGGPLGGEASYLRLGDAQLEYLTQKFDSIVREGTEMAKKRLPAEERKLLGLNEAREAKGVTRKQREAGDEPVRASSFAQIGTASVEIEKHDHDLIKKTWMPKSLEGVAFVDDLDTHLPSVLPGLFKS